VPASGRPLPFSVVYDPDAAAELTVAVKSKIAGAVHHYRQGPTSRGGVGAHAGGLPRIQHKPLVRVLATDLADSPADVLVGLRPMRDELHATRAAIEAGRQRATELPERRERLLAQAQMAYRLLVRSSSCSTTSRSCSASKGQSCHVAEAFRGRRDERLHHRGHRARS